MILYRTTHPYYPFIWESDEQPPARWHAEGEGPVHYFATTPEGAWAEVLRHEEITDPEDLKGLTERAMWIVQLSEAPSDARDLDAPDLDAATLTGSQNTYAACREEARRIRASDSSGFIAPSAALRAEGAVKYTDSDGVQLEPVDSNVVVLFGRRSDLTAQLAGIGRPADRLLEHVRPLGD